MQISFNEAWSHNFSQFKKPLLLVSGGVDSITLLYMLHKAKSCGVISSLHVLHISHGLRREENEKEIISIKNICRSFGTETSSIEMEEDFPEGKSSMKKIFSRVDVGKTSRVDNDLKKNVDKNKLHSVPLVVMWQIHIGKNVQQSTRKFRYYHAFRVAKSIAADCIVTAHHKNDAIETSLLAFLQGKSSSTIAALGPRVVLKYGGKKMPLLRPLLSLTKKKIEQYAIAKKLKFNEDSSNNKNDYLRNFLRNAVLPEIERKIPTYVGGVLQTKNLLSNNNALLKKLLQGVLITIGNYLFINKRYFALPSSMQRSALYIATHKWFSPLRVGRGSYYMMAKVLEDACIAQKKNDYAQRTLLVLQRKGVRYECLFAHNIIQFSRLKERGSNTDPQVTQLGKEAKYEEPLYNRVKYFSSTFTGKGRVSAQVESILQHTLYSTSLVIDWNLQRHKVLLQVVSAFPWLQIPKNKRSFDLQRKGKLNKKYCAKYSQLLMRNCLLVRIAFQEEKKSMDEILANPLQWKVLAVFHPVLVFAEKKKVLENGFNFPKPFVSFAKQNFYKFQDTSLEPEINIKIE